MEQIVFPIPEICEYVTKDTKVRVFHTAERDDQGSKVAAFFQRVDDMFDEMKWQKKLRGCLRSIITIWLTNSPDWLTRPSSKQTPKWKKKN